MRVFTALVFSLVASTAFAQSGSTNTQTKTLPTRLDERPSAVLLLAQADPADKKTFECTCTDAVDKTKVNKKTCNKGDTCSCARGEPKCTKQ